MELQGENLIMFNREKLLILALTVLTFILGTTEYVIVGLLGNVAKTFDVSVATVGTLVSIFAISFAAGTPIAMMIASFYSKSTSLITGSLLVALLNIGIAFSPNYFCLSLLRIITAISCGLCVSLALSISTDSVSNEQKGKAISYIMGGFSIANVFGVPIGTFVAMHFQWQTTFLLIGVLGAVCTILLFKVVPKDLPRVQSSIRAQFRLLTTPRIFIAFSIPIMGISAIFVIYTFIVPLMTEIMKIPSSWSSTLLLLYGIATIISNLIGGKIATRNFVYKLRNVFLLHALIFILLGLTEHSSILGILLIIAIGTICFSINAAAQLYLIQLTESLVPEAKDFASSLMPIGANIGIAVGSGAGSLITEFFGLQFLPWAAVIFSLSAFGLTAFSITLNRLQRPIPKVNRKSF